MSEYRVQLDVFTGPLDLLLYLIKRDEVDIYDIPIARIAEQYLTQVQLLKQLDPNAVSEFLVLAATLLELKSRALLPTPPIDDLTDSEDPRAPLVKQLLEYKRFKDAARALGHAADDRAARFVRKPVELPKELQGVELEEAQVWDLLTAFSKVMTAIGRGPGEHQVRYEDMPIEVHQAEIVNVLQEQGALAFAELFTEPQNRLHILGRFLALLELIRGQRVRAEQEMLFGAIYLFLLEEAPDVTAEEEAALAAEPQTHASVETPTEPEADAAAAPIADEPEAAAAGPSAEAETSMPAGDASPAAEENSHEQAE